MKLLQIIRSTLKPSQVPDGPVALRPIDQGVDIVIEGDQNHEHQFAEAEWNQSRDGSSITDMDEDPGGPFAFPRATYKTLMRCSCGREGIHNSRSLI